MDILTRIENESHQTESPGIEIGDFSTPGAAAALPRKIVVATFNVRYAVGSFLITGSLLRRVGIKRPRRRAALIAAHIERAAHAMSDGRLMPPPHVVALQEADKGTVRAGRRHVARELAERLRARYAHATFDSPRDVAQKRKQWYLDFEEHIELDDPGETGLAFLSELPFANVERLELPWTDCPWRPHLALHARFSLGAPDRHLSIYNAHIDPHASVAEQLAQHRVIIEHARARAEQGEPTLLVGDFNTLSRHARAEMRRLLEGAGYATPMPTGVFTWRAGLYRLHADWIFARGVREVARWGVARPLGVSDHWPVWAEIEL